MRTLVAKYGGTWGSTAERVIETQDHYLSLFEKEKPDLLIVVLSASGSINDGKGRNDKYTNIFERIYSGTDTEQNMRFFVERENEICSKLGIERSHHVYRDLEEAVNSRENGNPKSYSAIVGQPERFMILNHEALAKKRGLELKVLDYNQTGIITKEHIDVHVAEELRVEIAKAFKGLRGIVIVPGFIAKNQKGEISTFERDGSNTSAVEIGAGTGSYKIYILNYEEDGVRTAPPHIVPWASVVERMTGKEAIEYVKSGAKIIPKYIDPAMNENIPICIVDKNLKGTTISNEVSLEHMGAKLIASVPNLKLLNVKYGEDKPGELNRISGYFTRANTNIFRCPEEFNNQSFFFLKDGKCNLDKLMEIENEYKNPSLKTDFVAISIIGEGMKYQTAAVVEKVASVYKKGGVPLKAMSFPDEHINITTFTEDRYERTIVGGIYDAFFGNNSR